jgi:uncharacterized membrane protein YhaH (DUF805 family)
MNWYLSVLKNYATFSGRARRAEYWTFILIHVIIVVVLSLGAESAELMVFVFGLYIVGTIIPTIALTVRRLHDTGRSGWWWLISLVPFIGDLVLFVFMIFKSEEGSNDYGENPLEVESQ